MCSKSATIWLQSIRNLIYFFTIINYDVLIFLVSFYQNSFKNTLIQIFRYIHLYKIFWKCLDLLVDAYRWGGLSFSPELAAGPLWSEFWIRLGSWTCWTFLHQIFYNRQFRSVTTKYSIPNYYNPYLVQQTITFKALTLRDCCYWLKLIPPQILLPLPLQILAVCPSALQTFSLHKPS